MASKLLSKSKYLSGLQCPKYLWLLVHASERIPEPDTATQHRFDQGHVVGGLAKRLFPDGIDIPVNDFMGNIRQTLQRIDQRDTFFEGGIMVNDLYFRADVMNPVSDNEWDIIEVKSSTSVKDVDVHDVSFQKYCCDLLGLKIRKCHLMHINRDYVRQGEIDPEQLFITEDITENVGSAINWIPGMIEDMRKTIEADECPDISISKRCMNPYECPLKGECHDFLPENSVMELYRGGDKCYALLLNGVQHIADIPEDFKLNDKQQIQRNCVLDGLPYIDSEGVQQFLDMLRYPLYYLDFETISPAVPLFDGTRPYQRIPFQYSLHVVMAEHAMPLHFSFLAEDTSDPRLTFITELKSQLGKKGSIIVYNKSFEEGVLKDIAVSFPEHKAWVDDVCARMVDLLEPFRNFHYHHPLQKGSASLKNVLPVLSHLSHKDLEIQNGEDASISFLTATFGDVSEEERVKLREDLVVYCCMDTEGMIHIVENLKNIVNSNRNPEP
jgi:hypothetical protein